MVRDVLHNAMGNSKVFAYLFPISDQNLKISIPSYTISKKIVTRGWKCGPIWMSLQKWVPFQRKQDWWEGTLGTSWVKRNVFLLLLILLKILSVWWSTHSDATMTRQVIGESRAENINVVILQVTIALCPLTSQSMSEKLLYCFQKLSIKKSRRQMKTREILFLNL